MWKFMGKVLREDILVTEGVDGSENVSGKVNLLVFRSY